MHPLRSTVAGAVWDIVVEEGQLVAEEDEIIVLRTADGSTKSVYTDVPGVLRELHVATGQTVERGDVIALIDEA